MKKLMTLFVMAVLILSLAPSILARQEQPSRSGTENGVIEINEELENGEGIVTANKMERPKLVPKQIRANEQVNAQRVQKILGAKALVQTRNMEQIREHQEEKLKLAIEKCKEQNLDEELCEKKFRKRLELVDKLESKDLERIRTLEAKKISTVKKIKELREKPEFAKFDEAKEFKARIVSQEKLQRARNAFIKAEEKFEDSKKKYQIAKDKFTATKDRLQKCAKGECEDVRTEMRSHVKKSLQKTIDIIESKLTQIKERVEESEVLTETEASALIAQIGSKLEKLNNLKARLEAKEEFNNKELKEITSELRKSLKDVTNTAKRASMKVMNSRIGGIIVKSQHLQLKLERTLTKAAEKEIDTDEVTQYVEQFGNLIDEAKSEHESALNLFKEGKIQEAQAAMKRAHQRLQRSHVVLKNIVSKLRVIGMQEDLEEDNESEIEEEIEEELEEAEDENEGAE